MIPICDLPSSAILMELHPTLRAKVEWLISDRQRTGLAFRPAYGFVSFGWQEELWTIGRAEDGSVLYDSEGVPKSVTSAHAGQSWHNYGLAVDVAYFQGDIILLPRNNRDLYDELGDRAAHVGLMWGGRFPDWYDATHFEWQGVLESTEQAWDLLGRGGLPLVWRAASGQV